MREVATAQQHVAPCAPNEYHGWSLGACVERGGSVTMNSSAEEIPVLIVGAGPVGLALAGDLGWRGTPCIVVEQSDGSIYQPRQDLVGIRTMEFCRRWGLTADVEASPYPRDYPQDNIYIAGSLADGWEIGRHASPAMDDSPPPPQSPARRERCPQDMFDPILARFARSFDCVDIRYRNRFVSLDQDPDGVTVEIEDMARGERRAVRTRFMVGCDGANSRVRDAIGLDMTGEAALTYTTNIIFRSAGFEALHDKRPGYRFIFLDENGTWATIVAINGRDQWRMSIIGNRHKRRELTTDEIEAAVRRAVGRAFDYEILSVLPWTRRELVAERLTEGNVFLVGDAAHCMSPTGGFGMNTGIGDVVDLSWKLTAVLQGWAGGGLVASYDIERRPVGWRNVPEASGNLGRMLSPGHNPDLIDATEDGARTRDVAGRDLDEAMQREWNTLGVHLGYRYDESPIVWPDGTPTPPDEVMTYTQTARPGARAPHVGLSDESSTLDLFGRDFVLLRLGPGAPDPSALVDAAAERGLPLTVSDLDEPAVLDAYQRRLVLVRPDGHVAWRDDAPPADAVAVIDKVRGG